MTNPSNKAESKEEANSAKTHSKYGDDDRAYGYDLYPERKGQTYKPGWFNTIFRGEGREHIDRVKCERNVYACVKNSPLVKLMMAALKKSGCEIDIRRHIVCEYCNTTVTGGYDPELNQIVVCQNSAKHEGIVQGILTHEMIHMFDYCCNKLDFKNIEHLACTEIRAANLAHCSFLSAWSQGNASIFNIKKQHQECVKTKALVSVLAARDVDPKEALAVVNKVFDKCYSDLEPIGRRIKRNSLDMHRAYLEGYLYGYE